MSPTSRSITSSLPMRGTPHECRDGGPGRDVFHAAFRRRQNRQVGGEDLNSGFVAELPSDCTSAQFGEQIGRFGAEAEMMLARRSPCGWCSKPRCWHRPRHRSTRGARRRRPECSCPSRRRTAAGPIRRAPHRRRGWACRSAAPAARRSGFRGSVPAGTDGLAAVCCDTKQYPDMVRRSQTAKLWRSKTALNKSPCARKAGGSSARDPSGSTTTRSSMGGWSNSAGKAPRIPPGLPARPANW